MTIHFIASYQKLKVYQMAFQGSIAVYHWVQPLLETSEVHLLRQLSATAQTVRTHIVAAWGQRRYQAGFISDLSLAQLAAADMQRWIEAGIAIGYLDLDAGQDLYDHYHDLYTALDQLMVTASTAPTASRKMSEYPLPATA